MTLGIIQERPGLGSLLGAGLGQGLQRGITSGADYMMKLGLSRAAESRKLTQKYKDQLAPRLRQYAKDYQETLISPGHEEDLRKIHTNAEKYIDQGYSLDEAIFLAFQEPEELSKEETESIKSRGQGIENKPNLGLETNEEYPGGWLGALFSKGGREKLAKDYRENIEEPGREFFRSATATAKAHPFQLAKELPVGASKAIENILSLGGAIPIPQNDRLSQLLAEKLRKDLTPEEQKGAEAIANIESLFGPGYGIKSLGGKFSRSLGLGEKASTIAPQLAREAMTAGKTAEETVLPAAMKEAEVPLAERVSEKAPSEATQRRIERLSPESKLYKTEEQVKLRNEQLKLHPKYVAEIEKDALDRLSRQREPGPQALATKAQKIEHYTVQTPKAQATYQDAVARVRALENEISRLPMAERARSEALLNMAKQGLQDAEFELRQIINNAKTGESRAGLAEMREAARNKTVDLEQQVSEGKEVALKKADYNPEFVKQAKVLEKKSKVPAAKQDDYYTQVHDTYANEYKTRLAQIDQELKSPSASMGEAMQKSRLQHERQLLQNMVDSAQAENTIHRHKLALRELQQRKLAQERFAKLQPKTESAKMANVREKLETPEGREQLVNQAADEAKAKFPSKETQIEGEKKSLKDALNEVSQAKETPRGTYSPPKNEKEVIKNARSLSRELRKRLDAWSYKLLDKIPYLKNTVWTRRIVQNAMIGIASGFVDAITPDIIPDEFSEFRLIMSPALSTAVTRSGVTGITHAFVKAAVRTWRNSHRVNKVIDAYRNPNTREGSRQLAEYKKGYSSKIMSKAKKKAAED